MRKLKALLILLFAACLSLTLFACGGGKGPKKDGDAQISRLSVRGDVQLDDSDGETQLIAELNKVRITGSDELGESVQLTGADCDYDLSGIRYEDTTKTSLVVDTYTVKLTPKERNDAKKSVDVSVVVDHDWGAPDTDGKLTCAHDKATSISHDEDIAIHYGDFHAGTANTSSSKIAAAALTAEEASQIGLSAEKTNNAVFNSAAGVNSGKTSSGQIREFGVDGTYNSSPMGEVGTTQVPTLTAGQLLPGMSITIEGFAKTDAGENAAWGTENKNWNAPSYGIADRYNTLSNWGETSYAGGASVIVRSEGWVLYDGIGLTSTARLLAGLPAFVPGFNVTTSGPSDKANYGSHPSEDQGLPEGYAEARGSDPTSDAWQTWWVYSEGSDRHSQTDYSSYVPVKVTWTYRTYTSQIGVIEIVSVYNNSTQLRSLIKVPAATRGYYDTIIHGDYSSLIITKSVVVETETVTNVKVNGLQSGVSGKFAEGQKIDAAEVIDVTYDTEQKPGEFNPYSVSNDMLYYYTGDPKTVEQATTDIADNSKWTKVADNALTAEMKIFKVEFERSGKTFRGLVLNAEGESAITVVSNDVQAAFGFDYNENLKNNKKTANYTLALIEGTADKIGLTLESGVAQVISEEAKAAFSGLDDAADYRYIAVKLTAIDTFANYGTPALAAGVQNVYLAAQQADGGVLLAFAIKKEALGTPIEVTGIQTTPIVFTFGTGIVGFDVSSKAQISSSMKLDAGGTATFTYTLADGVSISSFQVMAGDTTLGSARAVVLRNNKDTLAENPLDMGGGITATAYTEAEGTVTITLKFGAFAFGADDLIRVEAVTSAGVAAVDYVDYEFAYSQDGKFVVDSEYYFYIEGGKLYIAKPIKATEGKVNLTAANAKGTLKVTANDGDLETAKEIDLSFVCNYGVYSFVNTTLADKTITVGEDEINIYNIGCTVYGTTEGEVGAIVLIEVDLAGAFEFDGAFGIEINPDAESKYYWWYDPAAAENQFTREEIGEAALEIIEEGSCLAPGIVARKIMDDETVKYYAAYQEVGGDHNFDAQGTCTKCGATRSEVASEGYTPTGGSHVDDVFAWYGTSATSSIAEGEVVEGRGTLKEAKSTFGTNGIGILVWEDSNKALFQVAGIGDVLYGGDSSDIWTRKEPYDETAFPNGSKRITSSNITEEHPYNTLNGVLDKDGVAVSIDDMKTTLEGGGFRYIVEHRGNLIVAILNFYVAGQNFDDIPQFTMTATFTTKPGSTYEVWFMGGDGNNCYLDGNKIELVKSKLVNSAIGSVEAADADGHTASSNVSFAPSGNTITATGMAAKQNTQYYLAFKVSFTKALSYKPTAIVKNGDTEITGSKATFNETYDELTVYIPLTADAIPDNVTIDLINYEAYTLQGDITLNLENVICSDITATATGADALTIAGGEFTITYKGGVEATDTIVIGGESKAISALATAKESATAFGTTGYSAYVSETLAGGNVTITFVKAAADLTKTIEGTQITLNRAERVLALNSIAPAIAISTQWQEIGETGWRAQASGTTLTIVTGNEENKEPSTLPFNVNAGHVTSAEHLGIYELAYKVVSGAVVFENAANYLAKATTAVYTEYNGKFIVALTIDLTKFEIAAETPYGFAIENEGATKYYTVAAARTISEGTMEKTSLLEIATEDPCENDTVKGYGNGTKDNATFFYGLTVRPAGHTFPAEGGECTACQKVTGWTKSDIVVGKDNGQWSTAAADGYDPADTEKYGAIVKGQKAVFKGTIKTATASISGSWLNMHGPLFKIGGLTIRCDGYVDTLASGAGDYAANKWHINTVESVKYDNKAYSGGNIPWGDAVNCRSNAEATITYDWTNAKEIVFTFFTQDAAHTFEIVGKITSTVEGGEFEKGIYEIGLLPFNCYFAGTLTVTGNKDVVSAENCNQWIRDPSTKIPDPEYTEDSAITDGGLTIGTDGTQDSVAWTGYNNNPGWIGKLEKGKKIVITGTQKASATEPYWSSLTFFVWSSAVSTMPAKVTAGDPGICMNHKNAGAGHDETFTVSDPHHELTGGTDFATLVKEVGADCNVTITFDWTQYNKQFSVTMKLEKSDASKAVETTYTFTEADGKALAAYYNIGIGVDNSYGVLKTITRTEGTPSQDLPGAEAVTHEHSYENGLCTTCGGVQPATGVAGTAVESKSWEKTQTFNAKLWTMTLKKGGKVVAYGTQEGDVTSNWFSLLAYVGLDDATKSITIRSDNFAFYEDHKWADGPAHTLPDGNKQNGNKSPNGEASALDWTAFAGIARHCDWRVEFDWTGEVVVVTMTFTGTGENQYKASTVFFKYTLETASFEGKGTATIGLGSENAAGTVVCYVATNND